MKKYLFLLVLIITMFGCEKQEGVKSSIDSLEVADTVAREKLLDFDKSLYKAVYYEPLDDTIYVEFVVAGDNDTDPDYIPESYFIVSSYTANQKDEKFLQELERWEELEKNTKVETYGKSWSKKYFVSLGKYSSMKEVTTAFEEFKLKYPNEKINFYSINQ